MRRTRYLVGAAALAVGAVAIGDAGSVSADHRFRATATVLRGGNEVPGPGDPDGFGAAGVVINAATGRICYVVSQKNVENVTMAHIHVGGRDVAGPIVVHLDPPADGFSAACTTDTTGVAAQIAHNPSGYYVNVHSAGFPAGAIRGQLR
jgi:hypothetical protein